MTREGGGDQNFSAAPNWRESYVNCRINSSFQIYCMFKNTKTMRIFVRVEYFHGKNDENKKTLWHPSAVDLKNKMSQIVDSTFLRCSLLLSLDSAVLLEYLFLDTATSYF